MSSSARPRGLAGERAEHALEASREREDDLGDLRAEGADCFGQVDGADQLVQRVVRDVEVPASDPGGVAREPLARPEERTLGGPCRLVPELRVADLGLMHSLRELLGHLIRIESLKRQELFVVHGFCPHPGRAKTMNNDYSPPRAE